MDEDPILLAISVILTQVRSARRAIEEVERNTSRYLGFEFAQALSEGARFGAPPMHHGALRVHVININDLAPGNSFGDFLMGFLGGVGNFIGGLVGGMVGGTVAGLALPEMIGRIERITQNIREIMNRLGVQAAPPPPPPPPAGTAPPVTPPAATGETLLTTLRGIGTMVTELTALFRVASSGSTSDANAAGRAAPEVLSESGARWLTILGGVNHLLDRVANVVNGLIILIPMVIGSIALLISNLAGIRRAILETFQFVLRNLLVLRGVLLTTIFETVASAARLVAAIVGLLSTAIQTAIGSIFTMVASIIGAAFDAITTLAQTLQSVIGTLLTWLVTGVFTVLRAIGDLAVFRTIDHVVRILPAVLEPIYNIVVAFKTGAAGTGFSDDLHNALAAATTAGLSGTGTGSPSGTATPVDPSTAFATPPDFTAEFAAASTTLRDLIGTARTDLNTVVVESFDAAGGALNGIAGTFNTAIANEANFSRDLLSRNLQPLTDRANTLANAISAPIAATSAPTGFEDISAAYERWLTGDGLARTLNLATAQFASTATATDGSAVTDRLGLMRGQTDPARANIEIDRVEIVIGEPAAASDAAPGPVGLVMPGEELPLNDEAIWRAWHRHNLDLEDRAVRVDDVRELIV